MADQPIVSPFPITVTEADAVALQTQLEEMPLKFARPIINWLTAIQQRAAVEAAKPTE